MTTRLLAELEMAMERWIEEHCENDDWPDMYTPPGMGRQMANAAAAVFNTAEEQCAFVEGELKS